MKKRLTCMGALDLTTQDGTRVETVLRQPRRAALLVYLAVESRRHPVQRDAVAAVFWPERDERRARQALNQALHYLRRALGKETIRSCGSGALSVDYSTLTCDATEILTAAHWKDAAGALDTRGDFLAGFHCDGARDFEDWLSLTRRELRDTQQRLLMEKAEELSEAGETTAAAVAARSAVNVAGEDEGVLRRMAILLDSLGDRHDALDVWEAVRRDPGAGSDLDSEPSAEAPDAEAPHAELPGWEAPSDPGHPGTLTVETVHDEPTPGSGAEPSLVLPQDPAPAFHTRVLSTAAVLVVAVGLISLLGTVRGNGSGADPGAVLEASPLLIVETPPANDVQANVLHDQLLEALLRKGGAGSAGSALSVVHDTAFGGGTDGAVTGMEDYVLDVKGPVPGATTAASWSLSRKASGAVVAMGSLSDGEAADRMGSGQAAPEEVAQQVRRAMGRDLEVLRLQRSSRGASSVRALLQAQADRRRSRELLQAGMVEDAQTRLIRADEELEVLARSEPDWIDVRLERARIALDRTLVTLANAGPDGIRALLLDGYEEIEAAERVKPNDVHVAELRGRLAHWLWQTAPAGDPHEARRWYDVAVGSLREAARRHPTPATAWNRLSALHYASGEFADAYWAAERAVRANPFLDGDSDIRTRLFTAALERNDMDGARRWCEGAGDAAEPTTWWSIHCRVLRLAWDPTPDARDIREASQELHRLRARGADVQGLGRQIAYTEAALAVAWARAGSIDVARGGLAAARKASPTDAEMQPFVAWLHLVLGEEAEAVEVLRAYIEEHPEQRRGVVRSRRFETLGLAGSRSGAAGDAQSTSMQ